MDRADDQHPHRRSPTRSARSGRSSRGVAEQDDAGQSRRAPAARYRPRSYGLERHRRRGDLRCSLAWRLARAARRSRSSTSSSRRPARDVGRRDAPDPLRPRRGRATTRRRAARADAVARARGGVGRRAADRVRARLVCAPGGRLGGGVRAEACPGHPGRAARASRRARAFPQLPRRRPRVRAGRAGGGRAARAEGGRDAGAPAPVTGRGRCAAAPRPKGGGAVAGGTRPGSRPTASCGRAAVGCANSSPSWWRCRGRRARSCSSSRRPAVGVPPSWATSTRRGLRHR